MPDTEPINEPTLRDLLMLTAPDGPASLATEFAGQTPKLTGIPTSSQAHAVLMGHLDSAFDSGIGTVLTNAWNKRKEIRKYADTAKYPPDQPNFVGLAPHDVKCEVVPRVRVSINHGPFKTFEFKFEGKFHIEGMELKILGGRIVSLHSGQWWLEGKLTSGAVTLLERKSSKQRLPGAISFGDGIAIQPAATKPGVR